MKVKSKKQVQIHLCLDENEADILKEMMQNPHCHPDDEHTEVAKFRKELFQNLQKQLKYNGRS